jgi:hypothetical protein
MIGWWWALIAGWIGVMIGFGLGVAIAPLADEDPRGEIRIPPGRKL